MAELKQFDKVWTAEDALGALCLDKCKCKSLNIKDKEKEE